MEENYEVYIESDKNSFDSGISSEKINYNENLTMYNDILEKLNIEKKFHDELRKRLSQLTDRRDKKKKSELCNVCFTELDIEDIKTCTSCCSCEKYICRGKNCSYWLPKLAKWECQLCNYSNASQCRTSEWINKQMKNENELYHPIRARSELNIPVLDDKLSATGSLKNISGYYPSASSSVYGMNLDREKVRNHVEEILAEILGGSLDNVTVGPMTKNKHYYKLFNKFHSNLSEKLFMLENTMQQLYHHNNHNHYYHHSNHCEKNYNQSCGDLPLWGSGLTNNLDNNNPQNISHIKLKRLIERIVEETLRIPQLTDFSEVPAHLSSDNLLLRQSYERRQRNKIANRRYSNINLNEEYDDIDGNNPQYFDPKRYQELLATAVLNKIVDKCASGQKTIDDDLLRNIDDNHNKIVITTELCGESSSTSSHDPRSESSLTDPIQDENLNDITARLYRDELNRKFDVESVISDSHLSHRNISDNISSDNDSVDDYTSVASGADSTWEENWLFKKRKLLTHPTGPIGMLVPAPKEDIKTMIGDRSADEISDFSETEDDIVNGNKNDSGPENDRIQNKVVIGGQNTVGLFDDLQTSLISRTSSSADNHSLIETKNEYVDFKYGLNIKENPCIDLTCDGVPLKNEAVNPAITIESHESKTEQILEENNMEDCEAINSEVFVQTETNDSEVSESNSGDINSSNDANQQPSKHSTIEFLAAIALGPVLTLCSPDINEDILKNITVKTDVRSLLTQSTDNISDINEEKYFDTENNPTENDSNLDTIESELITKQDNSGYATPESEMSPPLMKQIQTINIIQPESGKISPTFKQVRFNENPTVIKHAIGRNPNTDDLEINTAIINESLIANVFVDHMLRSIEDKKLCDNEDNNEENNDINETANQKVYSETDELTSILLPSDVLSHISSLLSDIDLGPLKDELMKSASPIPFDTDLNIYICPPPPIIETETILTKSIDKSNKIEKNQTISKESAEEENKKKESEVGKSNAENIEQNQDKEPTLSLLTTESETQKSLTDTNDVESPAEVKTSELVIASSHVGEAEQISEAEQVTEIHDEPIKSEEAAELKVETSAAEIDENAQKAQFSQETLIKSESETPSSTPEIAQQIDEKELTKESPANTKSVEITTVSSPIEAVEQILETDPTKQNPNESVKVEEQKEISAVESVSLTESTSIEKDTTSQKTEPSQENFIKSEPQAPSSTQDVAQPIEDQELSQEIPAEIKLPETIMDCGSIVEAVQQVLETEPAKQNPDESVKKEEAKEVCTVESEPLSGSFSPEKVEINQQTESSEENPVKPESETSNSTPEIVQPIAGKELAEENPAEIISTETTTDSSCSIVEAVKQVLETEPAKENHDESVEVVEETKEIIAVESVPLTESCTIEKDATCQHAESLQENTSKSISEIPSSMPETIEEKELLQETPAESKQLKITENSQISAAEQTSETEQLKENLNEPIKLEEGNKLPTVEEVSQTKSATTEQTKTSQELESSEKIYTKPISEETAQPIEEQILTQETPVEVSPPHQGKENASIGEIENISNTEQTTENSDEPTKVEEVIKISSVEPVEIETAKDQTDKKTESSQEKSINLDPENLDTVSETVKPVEGIELPEESVAEVKVPELVTENSSVGDTKEVSNTEQTTENAAKPVKVEEAKEISTVEPVEIETEKDQTDQKTECSQQKPVKVDPDTVPETVQAIEEIELPQQPAVEVKVPELVTENSSVEQTEKVSNTEQTGENSGEPAKVEEDKKISSVEPVEIETTKDPIDQKTECSQEKPVKVDPDTVLETVQSIAEIELPQEPLVEVKVSGVVTENSVVGQTEAVSNTEQTRENSDEPTKVEEAKEISTVEPVEVETEKDKTDQKTECLQEKPVKIDPDTVPETVQPIEEIELPQEPAVEVKVSELVTENYSVEQTEKVSNTEQTGENSGEPAKVEEDKKISSVEPVEIETTKDPIDQKTECSEEKPVKVDPDTVPETVQPIEGIELPQEPSVEIKVSELVTENSVVGQTKVEEAKEVSIVEPVEIETKKDQTDQKTESSQEKSVKLDSETPDTVAETVQPIVEIELPQEPFVEIKVPGVVTENSVVEQTEAVSITEQTTENSDDPTKVEEAKEISTVEPVEIETKKDQTDQKTESSQEKSVKLDPETPDTVAETVQPIVEIELSEEPAVAEVPEFVTENSSVEETKEVSNTEQTTENSNESAKIEETKEISTIESGQQTESSTREEDTTSQKPSEESLIKSETEVRSSTSEIAEAIEEKQLPQKAPSEVKLSELGVICSPVEQLPNIEQAKEITDESVTVEEAKQTSTLESVPQIESCAVKKDETSQKTEASHGSLTKSVPEIPSATQETTKPIEEKELAQKSPVDVKSLETEKEMSLVGVIEQVVETEQAKEIPDKPVQIEEAKNISSVQSVQQIESCKTAKDEIDQETEQELAQATNAKVIQPDVTIENSPVVVTQPISETETAKENCDESAKEKAKEIFNVESIPQIESCIAATCLTESNECIQEIKDDELFELIPPPFEFQNISEDESPTSLNQVIEINISVLPEILDEGTIESTSEKSLQNIHSEQIKAEPITEDSSLQVNETTPEGSLEPLKTDLTIENSSLQENSREELNAEPVVEDPVVENTVPTTNDVEPAENVEPIPEKELPKEITAEDIKAEPEIPTETSKVDPISTGSTIDTVQADLPSKETPMEVVIELTTENTKTEPILESSTAETGQPMKEEILQKQSSTDSITAKVEKDNYVLEKAELVSESVTKPKSEPTVEKNTIEIVEPTKENTLPAQSSADPERTESVTETSSTENVQPVPEIEIVKEVPAERIKLKSEVENSVLEQTEQIHITPTEPAEKKMPLENSIAEIVEPVKGNNVAEQNPTTPTTTTLATESPSTLNVKPVPENEIEKEIVTEKIEAESAADSSTLEKTELPQQTSTEPTLESTPTETVNIVKENITSEQNCADHSTEKPPTQTSALENLQALTKIEIPKEIPAEAIGAQPPLETSLLEKTESVSEISTETTKAVPTLNSNTIETITAHALPEQNPVDLTTVESSVEGSLTENVASVVQKEPTVKIVVEEIKVEPVVESPVLEKVKPAVSNEPTKTELSQEASITEIIDPTKENTLPEQNLTEKEKSPIEDASIENVESVPEIEIVKENPANGIKTEQAKESSALEKTEPVQVASIEPSKKEESAENSIAKTIESVKESILSEPNLKVITTTISPPENSPIENVESVPEKEISIGGIKAAPAVDNSALEKIESIPEISTELTKIEPASDRCTIETVVLVKEDASPEQNPVSSTMEKPLIEGSPSENVPAVLAIEKPKEIPTEVIKAQPTSEQTEPLSEIPEKQTEPIKASTTSNDNTIEAVKEDISPEPNPIDHSTKKSPTESSSSENIQATPKKEIVKEIPAEEIKAEAAKESSISEKTESVPEIPTEPSKTEAPAANSIADIVETVKENILPQQTSTTPITITSPTESSRTENVEDVPEKEFVKEIPSEEIKTQPVVEKTELVLEIPTEPPNSDSSSKSSISTNFEPAKEPEQSSAGTETEQTKEIPAEGIKAEPPVENCVLKKAEPVPETLTESTKNSTTEITEPVKYDILSEQNTTGSITAKSLESSPTENVETVPENESTNKITTEEKAVATIIYQVPEIATETTLESSKTIEPIEEERSQIPSNSEDSSSNKIEPVQEKNLEAQEITTKPIETEPSVEGTVLEIIEPLSEVPKESTKTIPIPESDASIEPDVTEDILLKPTEVIIDPLKTESATENSITENIESVLESKESQEIIVESKTDSSPVLQNKVVEVNQEIETQNIIEENPVDSNIENDTITDFIIPPPFDFANGDDLNSTPAEDITHTDETTVSQASHDTSQKEFINDIVENNSNILDSEMVKENHNTSTNNLQISSDNIKQDETKIETFSSIKELEIIEIAPVESTDQNILQSESKSKTTTDSIKSNLENESENNYFNSESSNISESNNILSQLENSEIQKTLTTPTIENSILSQPILEFENPNNMSCTVHEKTDPETKSCEIKQEFVIKKMEITNVVNSGSESQTEKPPDLETIKKQNSSTEVETTTIEIDLKNNSKVNENESQVIKTNSNSNIEQIMNDNIISEEINDSVVTLTKEKHELKTIQESISTLQQTETDQSVEKIETSNIKEESSIIHQNLENSNSQSSVSSEITTILTEQNSVESKDNLIKIDDNKSTKENNEVQLSTPEFNTTNTIIEQLDELNEKSIDSHLSLSFERTSSDSTITDESTHTILDVTEEEAQITPTIENPTTLLTTTVYVNGNLENLKEDEIISTPNTENIVHEEHTVDMEINDSNNNNNNIINLTNNNNNNDLNTLTNTIINNCIINNDSNNNNNNNSIENQLVKNNSGDGINNVNYEKKISSDRGTNTNTIPKLIDTKNAEAFCKTLDISDEEEQNLIPGSIAEREHKKWYNAVEMPNNPYAPEALLRRLDVGQPKPIDIPDRSISNTTITTPEEEILPDVNLNTKKVDLSIYSRDYYVPPSPITSTTPTPTTTINIKTKLTKMPSIENDDIPESNDKEIVEIQSNEETLKTFAADEQSLNEKTNIKCDKISNTLSSLDTSKNDIFSARLIQINDTVDDEQLQKSITESSPSEISLTNSLTLSEDSDTLRIYNLNKQETTFVLKEKQISEEQLKLEKSKNIELNETSIELIQTSSNTPITPITPTTPTIPAKIIPKAPRIRPNELKITSTSSSHSPTKTVGKTAMALTPQSFKFLHPKRKIIEPSQIITQEQYATSPLENPDKIVIEEDVVHALPSVKALAKVFLLTSEKCLNVHEKCRPKSLNFEPNYTSETKIEIKETESQELLVPQIQAMASNETIKQIDVNQNNKSVAERPSSPVLKPGKLKDNIAFFENLKKN